MLEFASVLTKEYPDKTPFQIAEDGYALHRLAVNLQRLNEQYCNGNVDGDQYQVKKNVIRKKMHQLGYDGLLNGDPRGAAIKLKLPSGKVNDWGNEGFCVPE